MSSIAARHLLIKFSGSRNPVSRRTNQSTADVTGEAAQAELQTYIDKINAEGATVEVFAKYATARSDCGSFKQGGDLGEFGPGEMQKQFEDGTRATDVGKMSGIVLSDSGYHIIFRTKLQAGIGHSQGTGGIFSDWSVDKLLGLTVPSQVEEQWPATEFESPEKKYEAFSISSEVSSEDFAGVDSLVGDVNSFLGAVSAQVEAAIDKHNLDEGASKLLKQLTDEQASNLLRRAFEPRVRNPSAFVARAAKSIIIENEWYEWQDSWQGTENVEGVIETEQTEPENVTISDNSMVDIEKSQETGKDEVPEKEVAQEEEKPEEEDAQDSGEGEEWPEGDEDGGE